MRLGFLFSLILVMPLFVQAQDAYKVPLTDKELERVRPLLESEGLIGRIHGLNESTGIYVFSWFDPVSSKSSLFSVVTKEATLLAKLNQLNRNDKVKVVGSFIDNEAPQRHISLRDITVIDKSTHGIDNMNACVPQDIFERTEIVALVHAVIGDGGILLIDYKNVIIPVYVTETKWSSGLYRNDLIKLRFKVRSYPKRPTHLELDLDHTAPIEVIDRLVEQHGKEKEIEGFLIKFPSSPIVPFDVFAIEVKLHDGSKRNYTLINFESDEVFKSIRDKAGAAWKSQQHYAQAARNQFVNEKIIVRAKGIINVEDPTQANPQVNLKSPDDIQFFKQVCQLELITP